MGASDLNPAAPTQVGTGADGQPVYEGSLNDGTRTDHTTDDGAATEAGEESSGEPESPDASAPDASSETSSDAPVDTGDATFIGAESDPNPDVVPIAGDSADDPNLGESGDPGGVDTGDASFAGMDASGHPELPPFDTGPGSGPATYTPSSDPGAGLPPPPLPTGYAVRDGRVIRKVPVPLDGGLPPPPLPKGWVERDGHIVRADLGGPQVTPSARPRWLVPAVIVGVVALGTVGFAATRGGAPAPVPTTAATASVAAPTLAATATVARTAAPTVAPAAARVTDTKVSEQGNVCLNQTILTVTAKIEGAKAGDTIVFALSGPGLPDTVSGQLDASGTVTATMGTVGPVKGNQSWGAAVKSIGGKDVVSGPSQVFGFCPNN